VNGSEFALKEIFDLIHGPSQIGKTWKGSLSPNLFILNSDAARRKVVSSNPTTAA